MTNESAAARASEPAARASDPASPASEPAARANRPASEKLDWQHPLTLRFRDLDYLGHVTAAEYLAMFEEGRAAWLSHKFETPYPTYVVARQEIDFDRELRMHEGPVVLSIQLVGMGAKSLHISETLESRAGTVHARSRATLVMWDPDTRRSREFTEAERAALVSVPTVRPQP
jgi:acyl-CoA thioester hydrolase